MQRTQWISAALWRVLLVFIVAAGLGCNTKLEKPPVEVTFRESLVGAGKILQLKNQTNLPLHELEVTIESDSGEVGYQVPELAGYEVLEVGWKKLGGYEIPDGAKVEVRAKGYLLPVAVEIGRPAAAESGRP